MNFRLFIYFCAVCGGWAAFLGWILGKILAGANPIGGAGVKAMCLGMLVSLALVVVDAGWNFSRGRLVQTAARVLTGTAVGTVGGLAGGMASQTLFEWRPWSVFYVLGWTITGLLVGASVGVFDVIHRYVLQEDVRGARRKIVNGLLGGTVGGLLGGSLSLYLRTAWGDNLWSPGALGLVALGTCIGLMIGLAQVIFRESWVKVEAGFRAGRELILTKPEVTIGRAESCDIGLFGDPAVERLHARIVLRGDRHLLADADSPGGTFLNEQRIAEPTPLRSGDAIRVGKNVLRFGERQKRS